MFSRSILVNQHLPRPTTGAGVVGMLGIMGLTGSLMIIFRIVSISVKKFPPFTCSISFAFSSFVFIFLFLLPCGRLSLFSVRVFHPGHILICGIGQGVSYFFNIFDFYYLPGLTQLSNFSANSNFCFILYRPSVSKSTTATGKYENLPPVSNLPCCLSNLPCS